jgi:predicted dehydrogenase
MKNGVIGEVRRVFADFSQDHKLNEKSPESRLKNALLGAGSLLSLGVYSLTWGLLALGSEEEELEIKAAQTLRNGIDVASAVWLIYPRTGQQAICSSSSLSKNPDYTFCRIEGSLGHIIIHGNSAPDQNTSFSTRQPPVPMGIRLALQIQGRASTGKQTQLLSALPEEKQRVKRWAGKRQPE